MQTNVGSYDAAVRFVFGCLVLFYGVHTENRWGLLGLVPILSAAFAFCPLYLPFHFETLHFDEAHPHHGCDSSKKV
jgi:hypothetical protein